jgi:hypothetical protein
VGRCRPDRGEDSSDRRPRRGRVAGGGHLAGGARTGCRRYGRERERLQASRRSQEARHQAQDAAVVAHYAQALADLQAEEEATLAARAQDLLECDDAIAALEAELPPLESERLEALHALYPYREITFARYLRAILGRA